MMSTALPDTDELRGIIDNDKLIDAVVKFGHNLDEINEGFIDTIGDGFAPIIFSRKDSALLDDEILKKFLDGYPSEAPEKKRLEYVVEELAAWSTTKEMKIRGEVSFLHNRNCARFDDLEELKKTCGEEGEPLWVTFEFDRYPVTITFGSTEVKSSLEALFGALYQPTMLKEETLVKALKSTVDRNLIQYGEEDPYGTALPKPYFQTYKDGLVTKSSFNVEQHLLNDPEKDSVLVVSGESGSGKTFFSSYGVHPGVPRLYLSLTARDIGTRCKAFSEDEDKWYRYLSDSLEKLAGDEAYQSLYRVFQMARFNLRKRRNNWAWQVVTDMINNLDCVADADGTCVSNWFFGWQNAKPLPRFLLVVDEVGRDLELAHGLVDAGLRNLQSTLVKRGLAQKVGLVLCGTNMGQLHTKAASEKPLIGSDPDKSQVVIMEETNLEKLRELLHDDDRIDAEALEKGFYSRIYMSNIRMTNRALLPFLRSIYALHESDKQAWKEAQTALCSSRVSMMFIPSIYCRLNSLRGLRENDRRSLFRCSFSFFLGASIEKFRKETSIPASVAAGLTLTAGDQAFTQEIFARGIATISTNQTSDALKFLAARGFVSPLFPSDGLSWETLVSHHLYRLLECSCLQVRQIALEGAWPPAGEGTWDDDLSVEHKQDVKAIVSVIARKQAAVLTQTVKNAQSFDEIALIPTKAESRSYVWELHQSKNFKKWPTASAAFPSLGVDASEYLVQQLSEDTDNFNARKDKIRAKSKRSLLGFQRLKTAVQDKFDGGDLNFLDDQRVVDVCLPFSPSQGEAFREQAKNKGVFVMTKEFFEPTVSACSQVMKDPENEVADLAQRVGNRTENDAVAWSSIIISSLQGAKGEGEDTKKRSLPLKQLRKMVLLSLQMDKSDKKAKIMFKKSIQGMEEEGLVSLSEEGVVTLKKKKKRKLEIEENQRKKNKRKSNESSAKEQIGDGSIVEEDVEEG